WASAGAESPSARTRTRLRSGFMSAHPFEAFPSRASARALGDRSVGVAVLGPRLFVVAGIDRLLLAVGDRRDPARRDPVRHQEFAHSVGAAGAEREVVLAGAALVGVAFDPDAHCRIAAQPA